MGCIKSKVYRADLARSVASLHPAASIAAIPDERDLLPKEQLFEMSLVDTFKEYQLTEDDILRSQRIRDDLKKELNKRRTILQSNENATDQELDIQVIGSCLSGIGQRNCGVHLTIIPSNKDEDNALPDIAEFLRTQSESEKNDFTDIEYLGDAKIPIIKLRHHPTESTVDVSWNRPEDILLGHLLEIYADINPFICPLNVLLKQWAKKKGLMNVSEGQITGFHLTMMLIYHQQERNNMQGIRVSSTTTEETLLQWASRIPRMNVRATEAALEVQLRDFFKLFYDVFDYFFAVDVREGCDLTSKLTLSDYAGDWFSPLAMVHPITGPSAGNLAECVESEQLHELRVAFNDAAKILE